MRGLLVFASISGLTGVAASAFGSHALSDDLPANLLRAFDAGARMQLIHAVALLALVALAGRLDRADAKMAGWLWATGTCIFSGSLYVLVLTGERWLGAVTPVGGVLFLLGWGFLCRAALRVPR